MTKETGKKVLAVIGAAAIIGTVLAGCSAASGEKEKDNASITVISREEGSGTRDAFVELMGIVDENDNDITIQTAEITNSTSVMTSTVAGNKSAIGYVSLGSLSEEVKALQLDGVEPSTQTVKSGEYKLQRPFNIAYINGSLSDTAKDFVSYIMSTDGAKIIDGEGYISTDTQTTYKASGKKGTVTLAGSTSVAPLMNVLADQYKALNPDVKIEIQESGSSAGIQSAIEGAVDIAMSSRDLKDDEAKTLQATQIALDGIAVIANKENSVTNITSQQVKQVYTGEITSWSEIN
ncbi:MAG: extracellular solute-binding protein [Eubacteriales bacterium]|nr:extracellular solute-binding protein [Eubacteriales bacterium]